MHQGRRKIQIISVAKYKVFMDTARDCMIVITAGSSQEDIESTNINPSSWNPFTPNKLLIILFTVLHTFPMMLVLRGGVGLTCVNVVRRKSVLVSHRSERVNLFSRFSPYRRNTPELWKSQCISSHYFPVLALHNLCSVWTPHLHKPIQG